MLANKVRRVRLRRKPKSAEELAYDLAYKEGYDAGRLEQQVGYLDQIGDLKRDVRSWNADYDKCAIKLCDSQAEVEDLQEKNSILDDRLYKAERARDAWRKMVRELTFEKK